MKKFYIIILIILTISLLGYIIYINRYTTFNIKEYGFSMNYPAKFAKVDKEGNDSAGMALNVKNNYNGINISVELAKKQRTTKSIVEIMNNYGATLKIFNIDYAVKILSQSYILIGNNEAGKVEATISKEDSISKVITILLPLNTAEITITINGTEKAISDNINQINKIINSIKVS
jgi:hypothetical protein